MKTAAADGRLAIVFVTPMYPPWIGGAETHVQRLCATLLEHGHDVKVITSWRAFLPQLKEWRDPYGVPVRLSGTGVHAERADTRARLSDLVFALAVARDLVRARKRFRVAQFLLLGMHILAVPVAKLAGFKTVVMLGSTSATVRMRTTWRGRLQRLVLLRVVDRLVVLNPEMREQAVNLGFRPERIVWLPCEVDAVEFAPVDATTRARRRRELRLPEDKTLLTYTGRFMPFKRVDLLIDAFAEARRARPDAALVLAGDGPLMPSLKERVVARGLEAGVHFTGPLARADVCRVLQASDAYTFPSDIEGIPCSLVEAMSVGLASLVSDISAHRQLIDEGVQGLLVPPGDVAAVVRGMVWLLEHAGERARMGAAARARILECYTREHVAEQHEALYRAL